MDTRYLSKYNSQFTLKKKSSWSGRDWSISDSRDNLVFQTESRFCESHRRTRLLDATGNEVVCFQEKVRQFTQKCEKVCCAAVQLV